MISFEKKPLLSVNYADTIQPFKIRHPTIVMPLYSARNLMVDCMSQ